MIFSDLPSPAEADLGGNASPKIGFAKAENRKSTPGSSPRAGFFRIMLKRFAGALLRVIFRHIGVGRRGG
jgi:hypothetical protein